MIVWGCITHEATEIGHLTFFLNFVLSRSIYNNITYLYHQYNISFTMIFCHIDFTYYSNICCSKSIFYTNF
jgi:hypothetical protein